jgi:hypothetical protein
VQTFISTKVPIARNINNVEPDGSPLRRVQSMAALQLQQNTFQIVQAFMTIMACICFIIAICSWRALHVRLQIKANMAWYDMCCVVLCCAVLCCAVLWNVSG